jgi:flavin-dependent dehydrogenase
MRLANGNTVAILGGGPSGSFAAMHLLAQAQKAGITLDVQIFEPRQIGPTGGIGACKGCAGIISANAVMAMATLDIQIPPAVIQSEINQYVIHTCGQVQAVLQPHPERRILSVYRGTGPSRHKGAPISGLDAFLLGEAIARGARHIPDRVVSLDWDQGPIVRLKHISIRPDLVVLAIGVNSHLPIAPEFNYQPPVTEDMAQDELRKPANWPAGAVGAFFGMPEWLVFAAMVPKGEYLNLSLLGRNMGAQPVADFYQAQREQLKLYFPDSPDGYCGCNPCVAVRPAKHTSGDRWIAVGEAAVSRLYKDGIFSAFETSRWAMTSALENGVDAAAWKTGCELQYQRLAADNRYGEILFDISPHILKNERLANACLNCIRKEEHQPLEKKNYTRLFWGMFTGDETYRELFRLFLAPGGLAELGREIIRPENSA